MMEPEYVSAADKSEIAVGKMKKVILNDQEILVVNVDGNYYAVSSVCTHFGGDLSEGVLENNIVTCPNHKARFDVTTGKVISPPVEALGHPDIEDLPKYLVKIDNQDILIKIDAATTS
jgi:nitrite reductase/ring-hydroxylating ferredoxin subunit